MRENNIEKQVFYDLLATEFSRKYRSDQLTLVSARCYILNELLENKADSEAVKQTTRWCFHNNVEAAFLLAKQDMLSNSDEVDYSIPAGLYGREEELMIQEAATDLLKVPHHKLLNTLTMLGHARLLLVQSEAKSSL